MVLLVAALFALVEAGRAIGINTADALFFRRYGVEFLPNMYILLGFITFVIILSYTAAQSRISKNIFYVGMLVLFAMVLLLERIAIVSDFPPLYPVLWLTINAIGTLLVLQLWHVAGETTDTRQAKRLYSIFISGGIIGSVIGNFSTGELARLIGTENLLLVYVLLLGACSAVTVEISRRFFTAVSPATRESAMRDLREGFGYVRHSHILLLMSAASVVFAILFFSVSFPFSKEVSATFLTEDRIAGFLGNFTGVVTVLQLIVSLFIANRLYARIGVVNSVMLMALTYFVGFSVWIINFGFPTAILVRVGQLIVFGGIWSPAWNALFNVAPAERRTTALGFDAAVPTQIGVVLSGVLLILGDRVLTSDQIFFMGIMFAVLCAFILFRMRGEYAATLVNALREGYVQVFDTGGGNLQGVQLDGQALQTALTALDDEKPGVRRLAAEMLGKIGARQGIPALQAKLRDPEPEVRASAIDALVALEGSDAAADLLPLLHDDQAMVRAETIHALAALQLHTQSGMREQLRVHLNDKDPRVRVNAALALAGSSDGAQEEANAALTSLLMAPDAEHRILALDAIAQVKPDIAGSQIFPLLDDPLPGVRAAALRALAHVKDPQAADALADGLEDPDGMVRKAAAETLSAGEGEVPLLLNVLASGPERAQAAVASALVGRNILAQDRTVRAALRDYCTKQIVHARQCREDALALDTCCKDSPAATYIRDLLRESAKANETKILTVLEAFSPRDSIQAIERGLDSNDPQVRPQALEALDTIGDKQISSGLLMLMEDPPTDSSADPLPILRGLAEGQDAWLRALAVRASGEVVIGRVRDLMKHAQTDPDPLVRGAVNDVLGLLGGTQMETLATLSTLERILVLRQAPLFAQLEPEDLKQIADRATERVIQMNDELMHEGDMGNELFIIVEGQAKIIHTREGVAHVVRIAKPGEALGELAILRQSPRTATIVADGAPVRALVLGGDAFKAILRDRPSVAMAMISTLAEKLSRY